MSHPHSTPPRTHTAYRVILLVVLVAGLFLFILFLMYPGVLAAAAGLRDVIESIRESYEWKPF